jgi:BirA family biotin operon repressor/biotin-[acetyl-CoA-carboxylase] ligase
VILADSIASTNRLGLEIFRRLPERELEGWIFALHQRRGHGRFERPWASPRGAGVYASQMLHLPRQVVALLPLAVGVGLCEGLARVGYPCRLKWPNDVLLDGAKVGGILLSSRVGPKRAAVVVGLGVNRSHRAVDLPRPDTTSLSLAGGPEPPPLAELSAELAEAVEREIDVWGDAEHWRAAPLVSRYAAWSAHALGDALAVSVGEETMRGRFAGITDDGRLRLATPSGEVLLAAGEIEDPRA